MTYETYRYIFIVAAVLCGTMFVVSILLFIFLHVPRLVGDLSGTTARKAIEGIREQNEKSGDKAYKASAVNRQRSRLTDKISSSGRVQHHTARTLDTGVVTEKISTQKLTAGDETTILENNNETTVLNQMGAAVFQADTNGTTVLSEGMETGNVSVTGEACLPENVFRIEHEITFIHSAELVG